MSEHTNKIEGLLAGFIICLIDDSRGFSAGIAEMLRPHLCEVKIFNDPKIAMAEIPKCNPDIIITDFEMGEFTGLDVIHYLRKEEHLNTVPILVLTSRQEPEILITTMLNGADSFVTKSSARDVLIAELVTLARVRRLYQEVIRLKQFTAIKTMISTYKHEFGNVLAILDGKMRKLERAHPELATDESFESLKKNLVRMEETLKKLALLKEYEEEPYSSSSSILKIS